ncbi:CPBP family intramembrane glutamic endopeptidase [Ligilactobacillus ceti]|uniref:CAAX prenyl protease 2/Lysostaphin resistance protein A-like domain-containing protein n=1 Tax=Ligilactobacillus ceti DSM 22408 TaxID=1122146 RepID=A0A0R2KJ06_9LACO|nr:CPBP family intramembrane glutamic endopeptidase [Ligilactobacillus ceti]KRN89375.1 hypothetical protein IV53_GL000093 [Ligilactobacillus ceti DSM 22408]
MSKLEKTSFLAAAIYIGIMAVGMYTMHSIFGYSYDQPAMTKILLGFEIVMTLVGVYFYRKNLKGTGFGKVRFSFGYLVLAILILVSVWMFFTKGDFTANPKLVVIVAITTLFVGISEELMFRGIVLGSFLKSGHVYQGIFFSALCFALLHAVNVLGGSPYSEVVTQVMMTFINGLAFAGLKIKLNNLTPLMIFHWLYDFLLIAGLVAHVDVSGIMLLVTLTEIIILIPLFITAPKNYAKNKV